MCDLTLQGGLQDQDCDADAERGGMEGVGTTDDLLAQVAPAAVDTLGLGRQALHAAIRDPRLLGSAVPRLPWVPPLSDGDGWARPGVGIPLLPTSHGASGCRGLGGGALAGAAAVHSSRGWERGSQCRAHHLCHEARGRGRGRQEEARFWVFRG